MHWIYQTVRHFLTTWGYWAVLVGLLGENAGVPLPGETVLMFASFLAHKGSGLALQWVIVTGIGAATVGDNIGFLIGRKFGRHLLKWIKKIFHLDDEDVGAAKDLMRKHGARTVFFARFIFGLRTVAGPLAGILGMEWRRFALFNFLGAALWVSSIAAAGYVFASAFNTLLDYFEKAAWGLAAGLFLLGYFLWRRHKSAYEKRKGRQQQHAA